MHSVYVQMFERCNFLWFLQPTGHPQNFHPQNLIIKLSVASIGEQDNANNYV